MGVLLAGPVADFMAFVLFVVLVSIELKKTENDFERARPCWATAHRGLFMKPVYRHSTISKETVKIDAAKKLGDVIFNQKKPETPDL